MKLKKGDVLLVASHNRGKVGEIAELLLPYGILVRGAAELKLAEPEETGITFVENAVIKARAAADAAHMPALADDSGLSVAALDGAPGIYSARWAGPDKDFAAAMARIEENLKALGRTDRAAKFVCALALAMPGGAVKTFIGEIHGRLEFPPRGKNGFGYDPIFVADGMTETFGQIAPAEKHAISHRARAFAAFAEAVLPP
jgi:XTP/dITP diphosphohydrolase